LFGSWQRDILTIEEKSVLPRRRALFVYRRKYTLKISIGAKGICVGM
jgi:hypothetical protein